MAARPKDKKTMANLRDVTIKVERVDDDNLFISVGAEGTTLSKDQLRQLMSSQGWFDRMLSNVAVRLVGLGLDLKDDLATRQAIEGVTFKRIVD